MRKLNDFLVALCPAYRNNTTVRIRTDRHKTFFTDGIRIFACQCKAIVKHRLDLRERNPVLAHIRNGFLGIKFDAHARIIHTVYV